jgi:hypothetical protein
VLRFAAWRAPLEEGIVGLTVAPLRGADLSDPRPGPFCAFTNVGMHLGRSFPFRQCSQSSPLADPIPRRLQA